MGVTRGEAGGRVTWTMCPHTVSGRPCGVARGCSWGLGGDAFAAGVAGCWPFVRPSHLASFKPGLLGYGTVCLLEAQMTFFFVPLKTPVES